MILILAIPCCVTLAQEIFELVGVCVCVCVYIYKYIIYLFLYTGRFKANSSTLFTCNKVKILLAVKW